MAIEIPSDRRLEEKEALLKDTISKYGEVMPVKGGKEITLLEIYGEWMDYLVKKHLEGKTDLYMEWKEFLLRRDARLIGELLGAFFQAKRRYGRDKGRGETKRSWFALCDNYCSAYGYQDADLIQRFFSSYSGAERRIYHKVEEGEILADTSRSLLKIMEETEESMFNKEMEKKRKEEKKKKEEAEKQQRKLERARIAEEKKKQTEEKKRQREEQKARKVEEKKIKGGKKSRKLEAIDNIPEEIEEEREEKEVDPDYPKAPEGWRDPVKPGTESSGYIEEVEEEPMPKFEEDGQGIIDFSEFRE